MTAPAEVAAARTVVRRAPGKLFVAGEYAVVDAGNPAILVAVDRYITVTVTGTPGGLDPLATSHSPAPGVTISSDLTPAPPPGGGTKAVWSCTGPVTARRRGPGSRMWWGPWRRWGRCWPNGACRYRSWGSR